jgi:DNA-binding NarL/FixJ family response regulator
MTVSRQHPLLRVLVVDDDSFTRTTLKSTLAALDCKVVAEADAAGAALRMVAKARPDVALLDLDLGEGPTGIDLAHALRRSLPDIGIVMLSAYEEPRLMGAGQQPLPERSLYLVKRTITDAEQLGRALRLSIDPDLIMTMSRVGSDVAGELAALSDQQVEIMRLVAAGFANSEIARRREMTEPAVEKAIARLIRHFDLKTGKEQNQRVVIAQLYFQLTGAVSARPR